MSLKNWMVVCLAFALPGAGAAGFLVYLGPPDTHAVADSDEDGLLDAWELEQFEHLDFGAADDPDGDGIANADEYRRGTTPTDSVSAGVTLFVSASAGALSYDGLARQWNGDHGPKPTINSALSDSCPGDTIHVLSGSYPETVNINGMNVTIQGEGTVKGSL